MKLPEEPKTKAWKQFIQVYDCPKCSYSKGRSWVKDGVYIAVDPCEAHLRMFERQGWVAR